MTTIKQDQPFLVRDPVHGYLHVAPHERVVVDHAITQRLRRVNQTGLAELIFPEARTSRFAHSLGAMHLASEFLVSAIENADPSCVKMFFDGIFEKFKVIARRTTWDNSIKLDCLSELLSRSSIHQGRVPGSGLLSTRTRLPEIVGFEKDEPRLLLVLAEASLRLAALFHDLGHLPLSHDFEHALQDYVSGSDVHEELKKLCADKPHEEIGHKMANIVFRGIVNVDRPNSHVHYLVFRMAAEILDEKEDHSALGWLHSLVDGELDVDRADYLLRDGRALGLDFASYDIERLVRNLKLYHTEDRGFETTVFERGLTSLESYVLSRCRSNRVLTRHHKSAQVAAAFRYCSAAALAANVAPEYLACLRKIANSDTETEASADVLAEFAQYSDGWWMERLRMFRTSLRNPADSSQEMKIACLDLILDRRRTLKSVWKREGDLSRDLLSKLNTSVDRLMKPEQQALPKFLQALRAGPHPVLAVVHRFTPFKFAKEPESRKSVPGVAGLRISRGDHTVVPMTELSPLIESLVSDWESSLHVHAFVLNRDTRSPVEIAELIIAEAGNATGP